MEEKTPNDNTNESANEPTPITPDIMPPETPSTEPSESSEPSEEPTTPPQPLVAPGHKKSRSKLIVLLLLAAIVASAAGAYFLLKKDKPAATNSSTAEVKKEVAHLGYGSFGDGSVDQFYPMLPYPFYAAQEDMNLQIFEGLVYFDKANIKPLLATSWSNPDTTTWLFTLKKNVKFHSGRIMTVADVKYSLDSFKDTEIGKSFTTTIKSVEIVGDNQVKIVTLAPDPVLLNKLVYLSIIDSKGTPGDPATGTGPYTLKPGTKPTETKTELVAFDDWHLGQPLTRALTFSSFDDIDHQRDALKKGEVNIIANLTSDDLDTELKSEKFALLTLEQISVKSIGLQTRKVGSPLANLKVRQALLQTIDPQKIMDAMHIAQAKVADQIIPVAIPGYNPDIKRPALSIEAAKKLLADAGYPKGFTATFTFYKAGPLPALADELAKQLAQVGVTLKLDGIEDQEKTSKKILTGQAELWFYSDGTEILDASDVFKLQYTDSPKYSNPDVTALVKQSDQTFDAGKRLKILQETSKKINDDVVSVPIYNRSAYWVYDKNLVIAQERVGDPFGVNFATVYSK